MIKIYFLITFIILGISLHAQDVTGTYLDLTKSEKETDSLILLPDSTFRYAFYYPKYAVSEYYAGNWKYVNGKIVLYNAGLTKPSFVLTPVYNQDKITQMVMTEAKLRKKKKGQVLNRVE